MRECSWSSYFTSETCDLCSGEVSANHSYCATAFQLQVMMIWLECPLTRMLAIALRIGTTRPYPRDVQGVTNFFREAVILSSIVNPL